MRAIRDNRTHSSREREREKSKKKKREKRKRDVGEERVGWLK